MKKPIKFCLDTIFALGVLLFLFAMIYEVPGEAYYGNLDRQIGLEQGWTYRNEGGAAGAEIELPTKMYLETGKTLILHNTLPENVHNGMSLSFWSHQQDIEICVDGVVRGSYLERNFVHKVGNPPSSCVLVDLTKEDAGKEIDIRITPYHMGVENLELPELSYGYDVWLKYIRENIVILFEATVLLAVGLIIVLTCLFIRKKVEAGRSFFYLGQLIIVFSMWELSESRLRQLFLSSPYFSAVFAFIFIELIAAYVMLFLDEIQGHYYKELYSSLELLVFTQLLVNTVLNFAGIAYYYDTLACSHFWSVVVIVVVIVTLTMDISSGRIRQYSAAAVGVAGLAVSAVFELVYFYLADRNNLGLSIGIGLLFVVGSTLIQTIEDIIAIRQQRDENEEAVHIANEANKAKTEFLALVSHELRTPLNAVISMNELILSEAQDETVLRYADTAGKAGKSLLSIINNILDLSKIEAGRMEVVEAEYDLSSLIYDSYILVADKAEAKDLLLTCKVDEHLPSRLYGDVFHIRQIIVNFLTNAIKYTDIGSVELSFSGEETEDGYLLRIAVKDTGIGMTPENQKKLFTSFMRFDLRRNISVEGTGLGLAVCKQLSDLMNGRITVESEYHKGSTFCIEIPQKIVDAAPVGALSQVASSRHTKVQTRSFTAPSARVLVVDDVDMNLLVIKSLLDTYDITVHTATSGRECLDEADQQAYDMIFMDYMMPEMDGVEVFHKLKQADSLNRDTPVIMLTANVQKGIRELYLAEGFSGYLAKPIDRDQLYKVLTEWLPREKVVYSAEEERTENKKAVIRRYQDRFNRLKEAFPDVDTERGLAYCSSSEDFYMELLEDLAASGKKEELQNACRNRDWKLYAVMVHALKGSARTLGLSELGRVSETLQYAAEAGNVDLIEKNHGRAMAMLERLARWAEED